MNHSQLKTHLKINLKIIKNKKTNTIMKRKDKLRIFGQLDRVVDELIRESIMETPAGDYAQILHDEAKALAFKVLRFEEGVQKMQRTLSTIAFTLSTLALCRAVLENTRPK